jgi:hypothetical protein
MTCPRCGHPAPADAVACPACAWLLTTPYPPGRAAAGRTEPRPQAASAERAWPSARATQALVRGVALFSLIAFVGGIGYLLGWLASLGQVHQALQQLDPGLYVTTLTPRTAQTPQADVQTAPARPPSTTFAQRTGPVPVQPPPGWHVIRETAWPSPPTAWARWMKSHLHVAVHATAQGAWIAQGHVPGTALTLWAAAVPHGRGSRVILAVPTP